MLLKYIFEFLHIIPMIWMYQNLIIKCPITTHMFFFYYQLLKIILHWNHLYISNLQYNFYSLNSFPICICICFLKLVFLNSGITEVIITCIFRVKLALRSHYCKTDCTVQVTDHQLSKRFAQSYADSKCIIHTKV